MRVGFLQVLQELCDSDEEARSYWDKSTILLDEEGNATREAVIDELVLLFRPEHVIRQIQMLGSTIPHVETPMLKKRLEALVYNLERQLDRGKPTPLTVADRLAFYDHRDVDDETRMKIGENAARYYKEIHGVYPDKMAKRVGDKILLVNRYDQATIADTVDQAIQDIFE